MSSLQKNAIAAIAGQNAWKALRIFAPFAAQSTPFTARKISNLKPTCPILATCPDEAICRSLALNYGVYTKVVPVQDTTDKILDQALDAAKEFLPMQKKDIVVLTGGFSSAGFKAYTNAVLSCEWISQRNAGNQTRRCGLAKRPL